MGNERKIQMTEERAKKLKALIDATNEGALEPEGVSFYAPELIYTKIKWGANIPDDDIVPFSVLYTDENWTPSKIYEAFANDGIVILRKVDDSHPAVSSGTLLNRSSMYASPEEFVDVRTSRDITFILATSEEFTSDIQYSKDDIVGDPTYVNLETGKIIDCYPRPLPDSNDKFYANFATVLCSVVVIPYGGEGEPAYHLCMVKQNCNTICAKDNNSVLKGVPTNTIIFGNGFYFDSDTLPKIKYKPTINIKESSSSSTKVDHESDKIMFGDEFYLEDGYVRSTGGGGQGGTPITINMLDSVESGETPTFTLPANIQLDVDSSGSLVLSFLSVGTIHRTKTVLGPTQ